LAGLLTLVDIPSSISFVMYSLSKNFISDGAKLEVHQDFSSLEYNLCISLSSKCVFCAAIVLLVVDFCLLSFKKEIAQDTFPIFFLSFFYTELLETWSCILAKHLSSCAQAFYLTFVFPQRSLHLSDLLKSTQLLMSV